MITESGFIFLFSGGTFRFCKLKLRALGGVQNGKIVGNNEPDQYRVITIPNDINDTFGLNYRALCVFA